MNSNAKLITVSNRLPVSAVSRGGKWQLKRSSGGLVTALSGLQSAHNFHWVGWPGGDIPKKDQDDVSRDLQESFNSLPVFLTQKEITYYYNGFCNQVIWPLFHYLPNKVRFHDTQWKSYREINEKFAEKVLSIASPGDLVWIHDFHLMLLPAILRKKQPRLKIGFFLHIPFPSSEVYRLLAPRQEILEGLLGADLIGFHSYDYLRHFSSACLRLLGFESQPGAIELPSRKVHLGVFPIGIDPDRFHTVLQSESCRLNIDNLQKSFAGRKIILGVDRLDYTKGIPLKLRAFERFLERNPPLRNDVLLYQVSVPSRVDVAAYQELKSEVDELVGRINGKYGSIGESPIYYLNKEVNFEHLCALYATSDIALLTPIRDGMNLVALEYLVCSLQKRGTLILSEFAGAAHSLSGCLMVNPWDFDQVAETIEIALKMKPEEKERRHKPMHQSLLTNTAARWGERFVNDLKRYSAEEPKPASLSRLSLKAVKPELLSAYSEAKERLLFLDYDGTLAPFQATPAEAVPNKALLSTLRNLAKEGRNHVSLVSGRDRQELELWFGELPIYLCAEHGFVYRPRDEHQWKPIQEMDLDWKSEVKAILEYFHERTPGALIEEKFSSLTWHYRRADPAFGRWQADELLLHLEEILSHVPVEAIHGHRVIEIRPQGIHKGRYVQEILRKFPSFDFILCIGDDRTDEDMYAVLPSSAWTCRVGTTETAARIVAEDSREVLDLLAELC